MLILIAHGSHDPNWREPVERLVESLQADIGHGKISLAYMECTPPTLLEAAAEAVESGADKIRVLPLFLTSQGHVERNIRPLVDQVRSVYPSVDVQLMPPLGQHPTFSELLRKIAVEQE